MQEIKKLRIVIASILKPVDDTRMFEKLGQSLANVGHEVTIIGFPSIKPFVHDTIQFLALKTFPRLSLQRFISKWRVFRMVTALKPDVFIFNTHELIGPALLYKIWSRKKVIYDIRENYYRNILYTTTFPKLLRPFLAVAVRAKELIAVPFIDLFFIAETGYRKEMRFLPKGAIVLENKCSGQLIEQFSPRKQKGYSRLLFSGTLANHTGVFKAIDIAKALHQLDETITLTIVGYSPRHHVLEEIKRRIEPYTFIQLIGGDALVPHREILEQIMNADFGIIYYPFNQSTMNTIPTKLYEYLACQLPILLQNYPSWTALANGYCAAIPLDLPLTVILDRMKTHKFYLQMSLQYLYWESEQQKLLMEVQKLFLAKSFF